MKSLASLLLLAAAAFGAPNLYELATDDLLVATLWKNPGRMGSGFAPSGAVSVNAEFEKSGKGTWFIEQQRYGGDYLTSCAWSKDEGAFETGKKVVDWGFSRQATDGSFTGTGDPHHSTSFFLEATARAILVLEAGGHPRSVELRSAWAPRLKAAAAWMRSDDARAEKYDVNYAHRRWIVAAAYGQVAAVTGDAALAAHAATYARKGLAMQREDGVNPEKGGYDVSYHSVGLAMAERYWASCPDEAMRKDVEAMLAKGLAWLATRIDDAGKVDLEGSTRIGGERSEPGRSGAVKKADYKTMLQALVIGSRIVKNPAYHKKAEALAADLGWTKP